MFEPFALSLSKGNNESAGKRKTACIRKGYKKSVVAIAHKMLRIICVMLSQGQQDQDRRVDDEALNVARNAPRWIRMLKNNGFIAEAAHA